MGADAERRVFDAIAPTRTSTASTRSTSAASCRTGAAVAAVHAVRASSSCSSARRSRSPATRAVVIGRSDIVGKPMALLLLHRHATVTICHSRTVDLPRVAREADILVAAIGRPAFVTRGVRQAGRDGRSTSAPPASTIARDGRAAVSARLEAARGVRAPRIARPRRRASRSGGGRRRADAVPGGVGPLTIAMLLKNTLTCRGAAAAARQDWAGRRPPEQRCAMLKVALTGGIATGKSYVLEQFRQRGVPCLDADAARPRRDRGGHRSDGRDCGAVRRRDPRR